MSLNRSRISGFCCLIALLMASGCSRSTPAQPTTATAGTTDPTPPVSGEGGQREQGQAKPAVKGDTSAHTATKPHFYNRVVVLCIGINKYRSAGVAELTFAESDAKAFAERVHDLYGYEPPVLLCGPEATKEAIEAKLAEYGEKLGQRDALILFFAGHGQVIELPSYGRAGYLVPYDANLDLNDRSDPEKWADEAIDMRKLVARVEKMKAQHVLLIADACCSGFMTMRGNLEERVDLQVLLKQPSRGVFAAATERQSAREDPEKKRGYFTGALLDQLRDFSEGKNAASVTDLFIEVRRRVSQASNKLMLPQLAHMGDGTGEFVFIPRTIPKEDVEIVLNSGSQDDGRDHILRGVLDNARKRGGRRTKLADVIEAFEALDYRFSTARVDKEKVWTQKFQRFQENAALGDVLAMAGLHYCYGTGLGTEKTPAEAYRWARLAYDSGQPAGKQVLGICLWNGIGVEKNEEAGGRLIQEASDKGFPLSHILLGIKLVQKKDIAAAKRIWEQAKDAGVDSARTRLAGLYVGDIPGTKRDMKAALEVLRPAAERGLPLAQFLSCEIYVKHLPDKNIVEARKWLEKAAEAGLASAQYHLASEYYQKHGHPRELDMPQDLDRARQWAELGASQKEPHSCMLLCDLYEFGDGVAIDHEKARLFCETAAQANHAPALTRQGSWHYDGTIYPQDDVKAIAFFKRAAKMDDAGGYSWLGLMYENARGVPLGGHSRKDMMPHYKPEALHWYVQAMNNGGTEQAKKQLEAFHKECQQQRRLDQAGIPFGKPLNLWPLDILRRFQKAYPESAKEFERMFDRPTKK